MMNDRHQARLNESRQEGAGLIEIIVRFSAPPAIVRLVPFCGGTFVFPFI